MLGQPALSEGIQSALAPAGPHADQVATLARVMFAGGAAVLLIVALATAAAVFAPDRVRARLGGHGAILAGGVAFPVVTLTALLVWGLSDLRALVGAGPPALRIEVVGERWWWRVRYLDADGAIRLTTANEIRIPAGLPVEFRLTSPEVIHSFWIPSLGGKLDMIPGRVNSYVLSADAPGVHRGQCAEFCGAQHALMAFYVVVETREAFEAWFAAEAAPAAPPADAFRARGAALFLAQGCGACHRVRGTPADGDRGPDLTHVGGRVSLGAGILPNNAGALAGWIASVQHLKPGALMPSYDRLDGEELRALAAYLEGLR
jgi:cytochrome c oxidase subunit 2